MAPAVKRLEANAISKRADEVRAIQAQLRAGVQTPKPADVQPPAAGDQAQPVSDPDATGDQVAPLPEPTGPAGDEPWAEAFDFGRLVPVADRDIGGTVQPTVGARDVHMFLGVADQFAHWFEDQTQRCSLSARSDWQEVLGKKPQNSLGGRPRREYALTIPAAQKIAMAASGSRGAAVRAYFIECERRLLAGEPPIPGSVGTAPVPADVVAGPRWQAPLVANRSTQLSMPDDKLPLTMTDFFIINGFSAEESRQLAAYHEPFLVDRLRADGEGAFARRHPVSTLIHFARPILDGWWEHEGPVFLAGPT